MAVGSSTHSRSAALVLCMERVARAVWGELLTLLFAGLSLCSRFQIQLRCFSYSRSKFQASACCTPRTLKTACYWPRTYERSFIWGIPRQCL